MKKTLITLALSMMVTGAFAAEAVKANPHKSRDQRMRDCTKQANDQQLSGDARSAFIAGCMKPKQTSTPPAAVNP